MNNGNGRNGGHASPQRQMRGPGGPGGAMGGGMKNIDKKTVLRILSYMKPYRLRVAAVCLLIIISAAVGVAASLFIQTLIDSYILPLIGTENPDYAPLVRSLCLMAGVYLAGILATLFYNRIMAEVSQGILKKIRDDMFSHMQTLPVRYFDTHTHGDVMSFYTNDTDTLRQMLSMSVPQTFSSFVTVLAVFIAMLSLSVYLTAAVIIFVFLMLTVFGKVASKSGRYFTAQQASIGTMNGYIEEMISGQKVVKVFCHEKKAEEGFGGKNNEVYENGAAANGYANALMPMMNNLGYVLYVAIAILGGSLALAGITNISLRGAGVLTLGTIASFLQLSRSFIQPISQFSQQINSIAMAIAGAGRIFSLLDEPSETDNGYVTLVNAREGADGSISECAERTGLWAWKHPHGDGTVTYTKLSGGVVFDDVDFAYKEGKTVLHNISLYAQPGQKLAFVGATGAGKTTITNLINRFYDIADGKIRYDGININKIKKNDLRRSLGIVLQDVNLFTGTVMDNIRYGRLDATDGECVAAAKLANADSFIQMLPQGYKTMLTGDGSGLSQGQRQLISIARAAVADPPVMILDEATSSIDTRTEAIVQAGMDALMSGRTVFVIAHRLSTVRNSDVIMVLDHGRIVERGSHDKLIEEKGVYYRLYTGAFEEAE